MASETFEADIVCVPMSSPGDVSQVAALFDSKKVDPAHVVAIMEQTEGDPYARGYATLAMEVLLSERLGLTRKQVFDTIPMMMIGGVGGIMSPHIYLFIKQPGGTPGKGKRLALGVASSRELKPEEYGTMIQVDLVADAVRRAMKGAGITDSSQIECVEIKCPAMTPARIADTEKRGQKVVNTNPVVASSLAKGALRAWRRGGDRRSGAQQAQGRHDQRREIALLVGGLDLGGRRTGRLPRAGDRQRRRRARPAHCRAWRHAGSARHRGRPQGFRAGRP